MSKFIFLLAFLMTSSTGNGNDLDLFSSMSDMQRLYDREQDLTVKLENHLKTVELQIKTLDKLLTKYYDNYNYTEEDATEYVSHPINTYVLLKRTSLEWPRVKKVLFDEKSEKELEELLEAMESFPGESELEGALNGIFLLHETYDLNLTAFSLGQVEIPGQPGKILQSDHQLHAKDLELLGKLAFNRGFYDRAYEFLVAAEWRAIYDKNNETLPSTRSALKAVKRAHDECLLKKGPRGENWKTYQVPFDKEYAKKKKYKNLPLKYKPTPVLHEPIVDHQLWDQFNALCRGEKMRTPEAEKNLTSFYLHFGDPYLRLGPFKLEVLSHAPFAGIFHDFFVDKELEQYIDAAKDNLDRSQHMNNRGGSESSVKRTSKQTWLSDDPVHVEIGNVIPATVSVAKRIRLATRMNVFTYNGGEPFQVANYGIGGVYNHHTDASGEFSERRTEPESHGDRVATFMGYLSDVTAGGATVFPSVGITSFPKRGSAIFWYNIDRNGNLDRDTFHGGCPVLKGSKWITNKWIRWYFQQKSFPCSLSVKKMDRLKPLSNNLCDMTDRCKSMDI